jgi:hypothetical protein
VLAVVLGGNLLGDAHPPCIQDELAHLGLVERREPALDPVIPQVARARHQELVRLGADQGVALLLGEPEAHRGLVAREGHEDDPADAELDPVPHERLGRPGQGHRERPNIVDRHHRQVPIVTAD